MTGDTGIVFELSACENSAGFPTESGCKANDRTRYKVDTAFLYKVDTAFPVLPYTIYLVATDLCLSWPKVLNLVTVRGLMKTLV